MITAVTTGDEDIPIRVIISTSGPAGIQGAVRTAINNIKNQLLYNDVDYSIVPFTGSNSVVNPLNSGMATQNHYHVHGGRHCAEPKALEAASLFGKKIIGMSTIWWGNTINPYQDPNNNPTGIFASPCEVCQINEVWLMKNIEENRLVSQGLTRKAHDI